MIKISAVSYLNTMPFIYGLKHSNFIKSIDLQLNYPSLCAEKLLNNEVDIALVPVAIIPKLKNYFLISDYCIGSFGCVETVCLYSNVDIREVTKITLDYQSMTSVALLKILLKEYWDLKPLITKSKPGFEKNIKGSNAALVIGDRAFKMNNQYKHIYDLSEIWKEMTGLPFVFAAWVSNKIISKKFIKIFNQSLEYGLHNIDLGLELYSKDYPLCLSPINYLTKKISYNFDQKKKEALNLFLSKMES